MVGVAIDFDGGHDDDGRIDDIGGARFAAENSCGFGCFEADRHDVASGEELAEPDLASGVPPCLADDDGGDVDIAPGRDRPARGRRASSMNTQGHKTAAQRLKRELEGAGDVLPE
ncbi:hypothetical protein ACFWPH_09065 [Nocardia sp. NPDC058499]|uniref:hypothetical protein n=1 Tax=Nocardia sp. NPDC058499 TaxID=3346530 RepID=UPI003656BCDF